MNSRDQILNKLRARRPYFAPSPPESYLPVTRLEAGADLLTRFTEEMERLGGKVYDARDPKSAIEIVLSLISSGESIMVGAELPLPGLADALASRGITAQVPNTRGETRKAALAAMDAVPIGITGIDAAFTTTATLAIATNAGTGRLPSLLPPTYIGLLPRARLYPRIEDWLETDGKATLNASRSVIFITGPSRTGDIEMQIVVGVHGPKNLHVVVF